MPKKDAAATEGLQETSISTMLSILGRRISVGMFEFLADRRPQIRIENSMNQMSVPFQDHEPVLLEHFLPEFLAQFVGRPYRGAEVTAPRQQCNSKDELH
jgi:hypothetical protein